MCHDGGEEGIRECACGDPAVDRLITERDTAIKERDELRARVDALEKAAELGRDIVKELGGCDWSDTIGIVACRRVADLEIALSEVST